MSCEARRVYDISPRIRPDTKVWPGDTPPRLERLLDIERGASINLSTLHSTVHLGAHADAPLHYARAGADVAARHLDFYLGPCQVMRVKAARATRARLADLPSEVRAPRVLIATGTFPDPTRFNEDFAALEPSLVDALHDRGVRLIGIDTPSVDLFASKDLPSHLRFLAHDMAILEGLQLDAVPDGEYELIALPLALEGADASPVRAILRAWR
jgi:arylformamidase